MRNHFHIPAAMVALIMLGTMLLSVGCSHPPGEGFAIYLTKTDIPPAKMPVLSHVDITDEPVIAMKDIITYNTRTHEITLTEEAFGRVASLQVPVQGKSFVVCVDRQPVYWGAFWVAYSSMSFDGVTIWKPLDSQGPRVVKLTLGYPSSAFYGGEDPRNNAAVMQSLEKAGKLTTAIVDPLPRSMKGYELYSWSADGRWHFTLITGTNRNKTLAEITAISDIESDDGWVRIHVTGVEEMKAVLSRLPQNEDVFWTAGLWQPPPGEQGTVDFSLPSPQDVEAIKTHAERCGLNLRVLSNS